MADKADKDSKAPKKPPVVRQGPSWAMNTGNEKPARPKIDDVVPADSLAKMQATNKRLNRMSPQERNRAAKKRPRGRENVDPM